MNVLSLTSSTSKHRGRLTIAAGRAEAPQRGEPERQFGDAASTTLFLLEFQLVFLVRLLRVLLAFQIVAVREVRVALPPLVGHESRQSSSICPTATETQFHVAELEYIYSLRRSEVRDYVTHNGLRFEYKNLEAKHFRHQCMGL